MREAVAIFQSPDWLGAAETPRRLSAVQMAVAGRRALEVAVVDSVAVARSKALPEALAALVGVEAAAMQPMAAREDSAAAAAGHFP